MPKLKRHIPKLCKHHKGHAFVKINGRTIWLGKYGSDEADEAYHRTISEWLANGRTLPDEPEEIQPHLITVEEVATAYGRWAQERYSKSEWDTIRSAVRVMVRRYGSMPASAFGPNALRAVRASMITGDPEEVRFEKNDQGEVREFSSPRRPWSRKHVNKQVSRIRTVFRWAASHEMLSDAVHRRLETVESLKAGQVGVKERDRIMPVPNVHIRQVRRRVSRQVRALIDLQLLTGARAGELVGIRPVDFDQSEEVWTYRPLEHKTAHHDKERTIYFGPRAQRIVNLFIRVDRNINSPIFSPREANAEAKAVGARGQRRKDQRANINKSTRSIGDQYTTDSYRRAIHRACRAMGISVWGPHRLRHNAATNLRRQFGIEITRIILGHATVGMTAIYAEKPDSRIRKAIAAFG